jgi:hypothetical protein
MYTLWNGAFWTAYIQLLSFYNFKRWSFQCRIQSLVTTSWLHARDIRHVQFLPMYVFHRNGDYKWQQHFRPEKWPTSAHVWVGSRTGEFHLKLTYTFTNLKWEICLTPLCLKPFRQTIFWSNDVSSKPRPHLGTRTMYCPWPNLTFT